MFIKHQRIRETPVPGGSICTRPAAHASTTAARSSPSPCAGPAGGVLRRRGGRAALAAGGRRGAGAGGRSPRCPDLLALEWIEHGEADPAAAPSGSAGELAGAAPGRRGRVRGALARVHRHAAAAQRRRRTAPGPTWFAERRLLPVPAHLGRRRRAHRRRRRAGRAGDRRHRAGTAAPSRPARIHGDLWPGNVLWDRGRARLARRPGRARRAPRDRPGAARRCAAARRTSTGSWPPTARRGRWPTAGADRVPLHQLHLLLVHTALFGAAYRDVGPLAPLASPLNGDTAGVPVRGMTPSEPPGAGLADRHRPGRDRPAGVADRPVQPALHVLHARRGARLAARARRCSPTTRSCG